MAERNQKVLERVRQELQKAPELGSRQLYELAKKVDVAIGGDTLQQFHARYVLPYRREQSKKTRAATGEMPARRGRKPREAAATAVVAAVAPIKRRGRKPGSAGKPESDRERVRGILLRFAQDFATAETKPQVVEVMTRLDDYISELTKR